MKNKNIILITGLIIFGFIMILSIFISYHQDLNTMKPYQNKPDLLNLYNLYINKFNYIHGLFMIPSGMFFVFLLILLDVPSPSEAYQKLKKDLTKKIRERKNH